MNAKPILLRRTGSSILDSGSSSNVTNTRDNSSRNVPWANISAAPGSGGAIDPNLAIPVADEDPKHDLSYSSHKRKQSGIPLEAEAIINRASVKTSLESFSEQERDEEEGEGIGIQMSRSFSEPNLSEGGVRRDSFQQEGGGGSSMPEMADIFSDGSGWSLKSLLSSRGVATIALLMLTLGFITLRHPSSSRDGTPNGASAGVGDVVTTSQQQKPGSKDITIGQFHEEDVGTPMEHSIHEYNKIRFFDSPDKMKPIYSKGPILFNEDMGGLHMFENVCLTNNIDALRYSPDPETSLRGLIFFTPDEEVAKNSKRCVPCSAAHPVESWEDVNKDEKKVGHKCGLNGLHAMYASSVGDWTECIMEEENTKLMGKWGQTQAPTEVNTIHFFQEPTFLLQFNALDMEKSLFDMLFTYLPHWDKFLSSADSDEGTDGFPFNSVISHSLQGCLSHSHNWFCEVLHQMYAFGEAKEIPWEGDANTLYCYRELYYNQVGYQRNLDHEGLITKEIFGEFREMLFRKFGLPRRRTVKDRLADAEYEAKSNSNNQGDKDSENATAAVPETKIFFYDNKLSDQTVWNEMESLVSKARELEKYQNIKFVTVNTDFNDLSAAHQARKFNEADAVIMAHGSHMANAIFAVDGTSFVEVGCKVESLIGNPKFMELMDGKYRAVEKCAEDGGDEDDDTVCVKCKDDVNLTMTPAAFEKLIDDVVAGLQQ